MIFFDYKARRDFASTFECFASVVPNRKLLSAQLSKTLVNRCLFFTKILKIIVILFCSIKISRIFVKEITNKKRNYVFTIYSKRYVNEVNR